MICSPSSSRSSTGTRQLYRRSQPCCLLSPSQPVSHTPSRVLYCACSTALLACVCHAFNSLLQDPIIWQQAASLYWPDGAHSASLLPRYGLSWKQMVVERPHPRIDGIYLLETKYWKPGAERFGLRQQRVIEVTYYRYLQFLPGGVCYYALLNSPPSLLSALPVQHRLVHAAQWLLSAHGHHVLVKVDVGHELQLLRLRLRQTRGELRGWQGELGRGGAWNRLRVVEFKGRSKEGRDVGLYVYRVPATDFLFYSTSGVEVWSREEEKERMRILLTSNDDLREQSELSH